MLKETKVKFDVIKAIAKVSEKLNDSKMKVRHSKELSENVERLNEYFGTTESETWILCAIFTYCFDDREDSCSLRDIARFFDCTPMNVMTFRKEFESLLQKDYIRNKASFNKRSFGMRNDFMLNEELLNSIMQNRPIDITVENEDISACDFVRMICNEVLDNDDFFGRRRRNNVSKTTQKEAEQCYDYLDFVKQVKGILTDDKLRMVFYYICNEFVSGDDARLNGIVKNFYGSTGKMAAASEYMNETNLLFTRELVEFTKKENIKDATLTLTHKAKELLLGEDLKYYMRSTKGANIITPESIFHKDLFYSDENEAQINRLREILSEESFVQIQNRLAEKGMCKGVAVLLYGAPGTGKTESVLQIAKATGRKIMRVDISASKSCWFGESEKIIKRIFTDYRNLCKMCRSDDDHKMPILLFNEADGILSKRKDTSSSNVAQTENAIQNIILEEMENLDGIMIATTNLVDNLDSAFERRFLFKIKFDNPTVDAKKKIWKSKLDWLDDTALETFAKDYDFSGGQIDNIVRKVTMDEVITGIRTNYDDIVKLCKNEKLGSQKTAIGF